MMVCMNCYQKNSIVLHNEKCLELETKMNNWFVNVYQCKICKTLHQVCVPKEKTDDGFIQTSANTH